MVHVLVANSFFYALKTKKSKHRKHLLSSVTATPGLSFNSNSRNAGNARKNIRNAWDKGHLKVRSDFVILSDTLNNSIKPHKRQQAV